MVQTMTRLEWRHRQARRTLEPGLLVEPAPRLNLFEQFSDHSRLGAETILTGKPVISPMREREIKLAGRTGVFL